MMETSLNLKFNQENLERIAEMLNAGMVAILPTDTLYGLVACVDDQQAVERVYHLKQRDSKKPCIILCSSPDHLTALGITIDQNLSGIIWPGPVSLTVHVPNDFPYYLHRGTGTIAIRVPDAPLLRALLERTGPLIAPSANVSGLPVAEDTVQAYTAFGTGVPLYVDAGRMRNRLPSTLIYEESPGTLICLRDGAHQCAALGEQLQAAGWSFSGCCSRQSNG